MTPRAGTDANARATEAYMPRTGAARPRMIPVSKPPRRRTDRPDIGRGAPRDEKTNWTATRTSVINNHVAPPERVNPRMANGDCVNPFHHSAPTVRITWDQNQIRPRVPASSVRSPWIDTARSGDVNKVSNVKDSDELAIGASWDLQNLQTLEQALVRILRPLERPQARRTHLVVPLGPASPLRSRISDTGGHEPFVL